MGVISRTIIPSCGELCFFFPALRPRSRQPIRRYKKLLSDIFPKSPSEASVIKERLLKDFLPDDVCPLGAHLFTDSPGQIYQCDSKDNKIPDSVEQPLITIDDDFLPGSNENLMDSAVESNPEYPSLLSVDQFLDSVSETTHQVGRHSVSAPSDMPYQDMANHCESLQMGKQRKMCNFSPTPQNQDFLLGISYHDYSQAPTNYATFFPSRDCLGYYVQLAVFWLQAGNPFADENFNNNIAHHRSASTPMLCAAEYQHFPNSLRLPASSPYDNFLKAAGS